MSVCLIAAVNPQGVLAVDGQIPWHKPIDLQRFKSLTMGGTLIMGRKTWDSIGRKLLPGRRTLVMSRYNHPEVMNVRSVSEALATARNKDWKNGGWLQVSDSNEVWVVGGADVYEQFLPLVARLDLTIVHDCIVEDLSSPGVTRFGSFIRGLSDFHLLRTEYPTEDSTLEFRRYTQ
jgi:dihydrofolate reductase